MLYKINIINYKKNEFLVEPKSELISEKLQLFEKKIMDGENVIITKKDEIEKWNEEKELKEIIIVGIIKCREEYGKMMYIFQGYDKKYPPIMVKYREKIGFNKQKINKYGIIKWKNWDNKYPTGELINVIGNTNILLNYYEYQLYAKELIKYEMNKKKNEIEEIEIIEEKIMEKYPFLEKRKDRNIFSIDPENSKDYDDALSIIKKGDNEYIISVYIANVALWLEYLDYWKIDKISSIYLPGMVKNMLPKRISEKVCSLSADGLPKISYGIDIFVSNGEIKEIEWKECLIKITHHFIYEQKELLEFVDYKLIKEQTDTKMDSHGIVEYYMMMINKWSAKEKRGIIYKEIKEGDFLELYLEGGFGKGYTKDETIGYLQISSPIRRIVDLINNMKNNLENIGENGKRLYEDWINKIEEINKITKKIKKVERQCYLLDYFDKTEKRIFEGKRIEIIEPGRKYRIYIPELKCICDGVGECLDENKREFEIFMLKDEENEKKKIRCKTK